MPPSVPTEILVHVMSFLGRKSVGSVSILCIDWSRAAREEGVWKAICARLWGVPRLAGTVTIDWNNHQCSEHNPLTVGSNKWLYRELIRFIKPHPKRVKNKDTELEFGCYEPTGIDKSVMSTDPLDPDRFVVLGGETSPFIGVSYAGGFVGAGGRCIRSNEPFATIVKQDLRVQADRPVPFASVLWRLPFISREPNLRIAGESCRVCLEEGNKEEDPLIAPCACKGSIRLIHTQCLTSSLEAQADQKSRHICSMCRSPYKRGPPQLVAGLRFAHYFEVTIGPRTCTDDDDSDDDGGGQMAAEGGCVGIGLAYNSFGVLSGMPGRFVCSRH
jgi:hypothetical protein